MDDNLVKYFKLYIAKRGRRLRNKRKVYNNKLKALKHWYNRQQYNLLLNLILSAPPVTRSCGFVTRSDRQWKLMWKSYSEKQWIEDFRVSKSVFTYLCEELRPILTPKENPVWNNSRTTPLEKQIAVTLYKLASCAEYRVVGSIFGIHKSTVKKIVYKVVEAIITKLMKKIIVFPNKDEAKNISTKFEKKCHLPQIIGCIDGTHIPILAPAVGRKDFLNRKGWTSIIMQAVVDDNLLFRDVSCKFPGSVHDASAFKGSFLFQKNDELFPKETKDINGKNVDYYIIGDPAYPLLPYLMKDFMGRNLKDFEENFNIHLNSVRVNVEMAFGRLKSRWRILSKQSDINYTFMPKIVGVCCILHNLIEQSSDLSTEADNLNAAGESLEIPTILQSFPDEEIFSDAIEPPPQLAKDIRHNLALYLKEKFPMKTRNS